MKKSTKGAAAAATAGVLLLGGAGSLAYWSGSATVGGSSISSGHLSLDDNADCASAPWTLDDDEDGTTFNTGDKIVPGDVLTKVCTFTVNASGNHLRATLGATAPTESTGDLADQTVVDASFTVDGVSTTEITEADAGDHVIATITVTFGGPGADNTSQDESLAIGAYTVTATQVHN